MFGWGPDMGSLRASQVHNAVSNHELVRTFILAAEPSGPRRFLKGSLKGSLKGF